MNLVATPVLSGDYGSWSFETKRWGLTSDGIFEVMVSFQRDTSSVAALKAYAQSNRQLGGQLAAWDWDKTVEVLVTFRTYLSRDEFNSWALGLGIHPSEAELRTVYDVDPMHTSTPPLNLPPAPGGPGAPGPVGGQVFGSASVLRVVCITGGSEPLTKANLDQSLSMQEQEAQQEGYKLRELKGVYFTLATVRASQLPAIAADPHVFLADVSAEWAIYRIEETYGLGTYHIFTRPPEPVSVFLPMEQFGLDNFAQ
jgi:hypothetical protein